MSFEPKNEREAPPDADKTDEDTRSEDAPVPVPDDESSRRPSWEDWMKDSIARAQEMEDKELYGDSAPGPDADLPSGQQSWEDFSNEDEQPSAGDDAGAATTQDGIETANGYAATDSEDVPSSAFSDDSSDESPPRSPHAQGTSQEEQDDEQFLDRFNGGPLASPPPRPATPLSPSLRQQDMPVSEAREHVYGDDQYEGYISDHNGKIFYDELGRGTVRLFKPDQNRADERLKEKLKLEPLPEGRASADSGYKPGPSPLNPNRQEPPPPTEHQNTESEQDDGQGSVLDDYMKELGPSPYEDDESAGLEHGNASAEDSIADSHADNGATARPATPEPSGLASNWEDRPPTPDSAEMLRHFTGLTQEDAESTFNRLNELANSDKIKDPQQALRVKRQMFLLSKNLERNMSSRHARDIARLDNIAELDEKTKVAGTAIAAHLYRKQRDEVEGRARQWEDYGRNRNEHVGFLQREIERLHGDVEAADGAAQVAHDDLQRLREEYGAPFAGAEGNEQKVADAEHAAKAAQDELQKLRRELQEKQARFKAQWRYFEPMYQLVLERKKQGLPVNYDDALFREAFPDLADKTQGGDGETKQQTSASQMDAATQTETNSPPASPSKTGSDHGSDGSSDMDDDNDPRGGDLLKWTSQRDKASDTDSDVDDLDAVDWTKVHVDSPAASIKSSGRRDNDSSEPKEGSDEAEDSDSDDEGSLEFEDVNTDPDGHSDTAKSDGSDEKAAALKADLEACHQHGKELEAAKAELEKKLEEATSKMAEVQEQLDETQENLTDTGWELDAANADLNAVKADLKESKADRLMQDDQIAELRSENNKLRSAQSAPVKEPRDENAELVRAKADLKECHRHRDKLEARDQDWQARYDNLAGMYTDLEIQLRAAQVALYNVTNENGFKAELARLNGEVSRLSLSNAMLEKAAAEKPKATAGSDDLDKLVKMQGELEGCRRHGEVLKREKEALKKEVEALKKDNEKLKKVNEELKKENQDVEDDLADLTEASKKFKDDNYKHLKKNSDLEDKLGKLKKQLDEADETLDNAEWQDRDVRAQLAKAEAETKRLKADNERLAQEAARLPEAATTDDSAAAAELEELRKELEETKRQNERYNAMLNAALPLVEQATANSTRTRLAANLAIATNIAVPTDGAEFAETPAALPTPTPATGRRVTGSDALLIPSALRTPRTPAAPPAPVDASRMNNRWRAREQRIQSTAAFRQRRADVAASIDARDRLAEEENALAEEAEQLEAQLAKEKRDREADAEKLKELSKEWEELMELKGRERFWQRPGYGGAGVGVAVSG